MGFHIGIGGFIALYLFMLAGFAGWVIIGRVRAILHTPLISCMPSTSTARLARACG